MTPCLQLLGGARLLGADGAPVQGRAAHRRRLAVLAVLGTARGRPVGRERLVALLWPDVDAADARHSLVESLSVIRRDLGVDPFTCVGDEVALDLACLGCDVEALGRAMAEGDGARAAALYAGPFLDGFVVRDAPEFERWVEEERGALAVAFARVLEAHAARLEEEGNLPAAVHAWRRLAAHDRYSTRVAVRLARSLDATGDTAAAVQRLTVHEALLRMELGLAAPPELSETLDQLRNKATAPPPARPSRPASPPPPDAPREPAEGRAVDTAPVLVRHADVQPPSAAPSESAWLAGIAGLDRLRADTPELADRAEGALHALARRAAANAGGRAAPANGNAVLARFGDARAAAASAVALLRRWEGWKAREGAQAAIVIGLTGTAGPPGTDWAPLRASVLRAQAKPGSILATAEIAAEAGDLASVDAVPRGTAMLPGEDVPASLVQLALPLRGRVPPTGRRLRGAGSRLASVGGVGGVAGAALLGVVGWMLVRGSAASSSATLLPSAPGETVSRLAVLGCDAPRMADTLRDVCDGTMDDLAAGLARVQGIEVVRPFSGPEGRPYWPAGSQLGEAPGGLNGLLVVSGRIDESRDGVRQVIFLSDPARGGTIVAADTLELASGGPPLRETLAARLSHLLRRRLGVQVTVRVGGVSTRNVRARRLFIRARLLRYEAVDSLGSTDRLRTDIAIRDLYSADTLLMRAEAEDPRWVDVVVERAWIALLQGKAGLQADRAARYRRARAHAERAVQMAPSNAAALEIRGRTRWVLTELAEYADSGQVLIARAEDDLVRARSLDEGRASALYALGEVQYYQGEFEAALHTARQAYRADPYLEGGIAHIDNQFRSVLSLGRLDLASGYCASGARDFPRDVRFIECALVLAGRASADTSAARALRGRLEAEFSLQAADSFGMDYQPIYWQMQYAVILARAGAVTRAREEMAEARTRTRRRMDEAIRRRVPSDDNWVSFRFDEAQVLLALGDSAGARAALDDLVRRRPFYRGYVRREAMFAGLFTDPTPRTAASSRP